LQIVFLKRVKFRILHYCPINQRSVSFEGEWAYLRAGKRNKEIEKRIGRAKNKKSGVGDHI
jgi:hypothetical protein